MAFTPDIDTGSSGASQGPWISWSSNGSAMKGIPHSAWVLRGKDDAGQKSETAIPAFVNGCVLDLDTLKLGWERDGAKGMAPERKWNPTLAAFMPRPDESKKMSGAFAWTKALSVRCAIGGGQAATWEQGSFAAFEGFNRLKGQIVAEWAANSPCRPSMCARIVATASGKAACNVWLARTRASVAPRLGRPPATRPARWTKASKGSSVKAPTLPTRQATCHSTSKG